MNQIIAVADRPGLAWSLPLLRLLTWDDPGAQLRTLWLHVAVPTLSILLFLVVWDLSARQVETSLGTIPGPAAVWTAFGGLIEDHQLQRDKADAFQARQETRNAKRLAEDPNATVKVRDWTGKPTYVDQIFTSLYTVFVGFTLAALVAVPLGVLCGMSKGAMAALNPLIQIFKPVSPLAWLPIVTLVVSAVYVTDEHSWFDKSFLTSAITVTLCSLWPALINTALGVNSVDRDLVNVGRVLNLGWLRQTFTIILPASMPLIFTGLRVSLGVGWMVLIAAEMLAQNPGLGKFVWDEFQNGSSESLARIMVAVFTIGLIGFLLDRVMLMLQRRLTYTEAM